MAEPGTGPRGEGCGMSDGVDVADEVTVSLKVGIVLRQEDERVQTRVADDRDPTCAPLSRGHGSRGRRAASARTTSTSAA